MGVVAAGAGLPVVVVVEPLDFVPDDEVDVVVAEPDGFVVVVVEPEDFPVVVVDDEDEVLPVVAVAFGVVAVEPRAVVAVDLAVVAVVEVALGFVVDVVGLVPSDSSPAEVVVPVVAPGFMVVVVVGLAFFGRGTVQVSRDEPS